MNKSEVSKISLMKLDIYGSDYSLEIERDVRDCLNEAGLHVVVTGERSIAAGCSLEYQLMCFVRDSIASVSIYDLFEFAVGKVAKAFRNAGKSDVPGTRISMITSGCELVLSVKASAGVDPASVPYEDLITKRDRGPRALRYPEAAETLNPVPALRASTPPSIPKLP